MRLVNRTAIYNQSAVVYEVSFTFVLNYIQNATKASVSVDKQYSSGETINLQDRSLDNVQPLPMKVSGWNLNGHV